MPKMNSQNYIEWSVKSNKGTNSKSSKINWQLIKSKEIGKGYEIGTISAKEISFPKELIGKRIQLKVIFMDD